MPSAAKAGGDRNIVLVLGAISALGFIVAVWSMRAVSPLRSDTASYLYFDPSRTIGYPAFLSLVRLVTGEVALAVQVQMFLLACALFVLGWSFHNVARRPACSIAFQLLLALSMLWKVSANLLTEALATACVALWCALLLRMVKRTSLSGFALLIAVSAVGTLIRPSLFALFVATGAFAVITQRGQERIRAVVLVVVGVAVTLSVTPAANYFTNGSTTTASPLARGILQHTLFCSVGPAADSADADAALVEQNAAAVRRYVETAPANVQQTLKRIYSSQLRFGLIIPALGRDHGLQASWQTDPIVSRIAWQRLFANPLCYVRSVLNADYRMTTYGVSRTPADVRDIQRFLAEHPPVEVPVVPLLPKDQADQLKAAAELHRPVLTELQGHDVRDVDEKSALLPLMAARILYTAAALFGLLSILAMTARQRLGPELRERLAVAAAMGVAFHGIFAITAISELGLARYTVPVWPAACTLAAMAVAMFVKEPAGSPQTQAQPTMQPA